MSKSAIYLRPAQYPICGFHQICANLLVHLRTTEDEDLIQIFGARHDSLLIAALACWNFKFFSINSLFGQRLGYDVCDKIQVLRLFDMEIISPPLVT